MPQTVVLLVPVPGFPEAALRVEIRDRTHLDPGDLGGTVGSVDDQPRDVLAGDQVQV